MYHLATFNHMLSNPNDLPKLVKEEQVLINKQLFQLPGEKIKDISQMVNQERNAETALRKPAVAELLAPKESFTTEKMNRFIFEEHDQKEGKIKYYGKDSTKYDAKDVQAKSAPNDMNAANYALMIFDKKRNAFRLVPIQRHIYFEKVKNQQYKQTLGLKKPGEEEAERKARE